MRKALFIILLIFSQLIVAQNDFLIGENYYRKGEYEKAVQVYKKLYDKSPYNTTYLRRLITCYQETNQFLVVENLLKNRLSKTPTLTYLNVFLGYNYERQQQKEVANQYYDKALNSIEINKSYGGIIGRTFKDYNLLDYALKTYHKIMEVNPNANYDFQIAQIYGEKGDFEQMFQSFVNMIDKNENYLNTIQRYISRYITDDNQNSNNILFKRTLLRKSISKPKNEWNRLLSWLFVQQKEFGKALIQEKALFARNPDDISNIIDLGKISFDEKDYSTAKKCFDFILEKEQNLAVQAEATLYNIKIAIETKQTTIDQDFTNAFTKFGENRNTIQLQTTYADYLTFYKNQPEQAKLVLEKAMNFATSQFQKARIKLKLGEVLVFTNKFNKALIYFSQIQTRFKNHELAQEARFKVAQTSYFKGDFKWAKAQLKVLKSSATQLIANDAVDLFLTISDNYPKDSVPTGLTQLAKADLLAYQNKNKEALTVLTNILTNEELLSRNGGFLQITNAVLYKKAMLYIKQGKYTEAVADLEKVIATSKPDGIFMDDSVYQLAELHHNQLNNSEKAKEYYQKIIFDHPSSIHLVDSRKKFRKLRGDTI